MNYIKAEFLKLKGSFIKKLVSISPLFIIFFSYLSSGGVTDIGALKMSEIYQAMVFNWWPVLILPTIIVMMSVTEHNLENKSGNYRRYFSVNADRSKIWISKFVVMSFYLLTCQLLLGICFIIANKMIYKVDVNIINVFTSCILLSITSSSLIAFYNFVSEFTGNVIAILIYLASIIIEVLIAKTSLWYLYPWSIPTRLMVSLMKIYPNGVPITNPRDPMILNTSILLGIGSSILFAAIFLYIGITLFKRKGE